MRLAEITIYPIKSGRGVRVEQAVVEREGLAHDRRFMVVDERGEFLSQREIPELARLVASVGDEGLLLEADGDRVLIPRSGSGPEVEVTIWGERVVAEDCGARAAGLVTALAGTMARVVRMGARFDRPVDADYGAPEDRVSFADGFPLLVATRASIEAVAASGGAPDARRFRPNLLLEGAEAFEEDEWARITIGDVVIELVKPCARCSMLDVDPDRGARAPGTLAALAKLRTRGNKTYFGQNGVARAGLGSVLRVGDAVHVERTA